MQNKLIEVLQRADKHKVFRALGYNSLFEYATRGLGLSEGYSSNLILVSRKSAEVPQLKTAIEQGKISLSKARRLAPVIPLPASESRWLSLCFEAVFGAASPPTAISGGTA